MMIQTKSESEKSTSSCGKRKRSKPNIGNAYKRHILRFRFGVKREIKRWTANEILYQKLKGIERKVKKLDKQVKRKKNVSKRNINQNIKSETHNLMTKVCTIDVNIQNDISRDSEDIELSKLLRDVIDVLVDRFIYRYPLLANVVRIPQFIQNIKCFQVPKYVVCTFLLVGSTLLKDGKFSRVFTEERRKRTLNYVTEHMVTVISNPDCLSIWTMLVLARYYTALGILSQFKKYVHLAARLAISMKLHRVDAYCINTSANHSEDLMVEKELKRRLWWCLYIFSILLSEAVSIQPSIQLKDVFVNLPSNDRLWHTDSKFTLSKTNSAKRGDMILSSEGEFKFDTFASYVMLFKIRHANVTFINRRESMIAKDMDKDYRCYLRMFTNSMQFQESVVVKFHNELKKILVFGVRNPDIVNTMNIEYFILRYCTLILHTFMANIHIGTSEVAYYENVNIPPNRVKLAKIMLIENTIRFTEIFHWLMSNFSLDKFDVELNHMAFRAFKYLTNMEYIKDLNRHNAIINGKNVVTQYFETLKSTSLLAKTYFYLLINFSIIKKSYDKANAKFRNIPSDFALKMLSPYDYSPWLIPNGSSYLKNACCHGSPNTEVHDPFLLNRISAKRNLNRDKVFLSRLVSEASKKQFITAVDLKTITKESDKLYTSFESLSISTQPFGKYSIRNISYPTLDNDPKDFYVKVVDSGAHPQNIMLLKQCKEMVERVFYLIVYKDTNYMYKNQHPIFDQSLGFSNYREAFSSFNFTELLYNPTKQAQRNDATRGCESINKNHTYSSFDSAMNSTSCA